MNARSAPRALYIHVPFCVRKCRYCDFASETADDCTVVRCLKSIGAEIRHRSGESDVLDSVYIGGGTPSLLTDRQITELVGAVSSSYEVSDTAEITIETNPGDCTSDLADTWRSLGINRVSVGAQTFEPAVLEFLGRRHTVDDIYKTVEALRNAAFTNISLDLIYGVPNQTPSVWRRSISRALDLDPRHISVYALTYESGTPLATDVENGSVRPIDEDTELDMYRTAIEVIESAGFRLYEISNFALPGSESRHNIVYWRNEPYIGIGPSAVSYVAGARITNHRTIADYIESVESGGSGAANREHIPKDMEMTETCIQMLRRSEGIDMQVFYERFGEDVTEIYADGLAELTDAGLIETTDTAVRHTDSGRELANEVAERFLP